RTQLDLTMQYMPRSLKRNGSASRHPPGLPKRPTGCIKRISLRSETNVTERAMQRVLLVLGALLGPINAALACDMLATGQTPLELRRPVRGDEARVTSGFGIRRHPILNMQRMHTGVDWAAPLGTPVVATGRGRVVSAKREGEYGNRVILDHGGGW